MPCGYKLSPAAQKRGFACGILFLETTPSVSPCSTAPSWREPRRISLFPCLLVAAEQISQAVRFARGFAPMLAAPLPANLLLRKIFAGALYKRGVPRARKAGVWRKELPYFSLPCVRGEQALSCLSGLPQKSHGEFCGKRSGRRIRSCGKRSAPQTQTPCRDEVWL